MSANLKLGEIASVVRSKNAGPYLYTFDVIFGDGATYEKVKRSGLLTAGKMAEVYGVPPENIIWAGFFDPALAFKFTMARPLVSGSPGERDAYGAQQHMPLFNLLVSF